MSTIEPERSVTAWHCELTVTRVAGGSPQKFVLSSGRTIRFGSTGGNDIVVDVDGVSRCHAELFVSDNGGTPELCIRDNSARNGTAILPKSDDNSSWQILEKGGTHTLGEEWQLKIPWKSRSRKTGMQASALERTFLITRSPWMEGMASAESEGPAESTTAGALGVWPPLPPPPAAKPIEASEKVQAATITQAAKNLKPRQGPKDAEEEMWRRMEKKLKRARRLAQLGVPDLAFQTSASAEQQFTNPRIGAAAAASAASTASQTNEPSSKAAVRGVATITPSAPSPLEASALSSNAALVPQQAVDAIGSDVAQNAARGRVRKKAVQRMPVAEDDLYAEIDAEIGLKPTARADETPATGPVTAENVQEADLPSRIATRPKKRARPPETQAADVGVAAIQLAPDEVCVDSSPERQPTKAPIRLTRTALNQVATAAARAHRARTQKNPAPPSAAVEQDHGFLLGQSMLREISVSPISEPGVGRKRRRKKHQTGASSDAGKKKKRKRRATHTAGKKTQTSDRRISPHQGSSGRRVKAGGKRARGKAVGRDQS